MFGKLQRSMASPAMAKLRWRTFMDIDVRGVLASVRAPTLVLARRDDQFTSFAAAEVLAAGIPNARFHSLTAGSHGGFDILDELCDAVLKFVGKDASAYAADRVLRTVMFTDIVGSTNRLSASGDVRWRHQLDIHDSLVEHMLSRYGGVQANHTGDGISRCSMRRRGRPAVRLNSCLSLLLTTFRFASASIPGSAKNGVRSGAVLRCTPVRGSARWRPQARCSRAAPSATIRGFRPYV
jgi:hypothetical protein